MKYIILLMTLVSSLTFSQMVHAGELKLKRGCLKDHPLAQGVTDPKIIAIYTDVCNKKKKDQRDGYLILAAQRFQQLGMNGRALQIINQLEAKNIQSPIITDTKFLLGTHLAGDALADMRGKESRLLSRDLTSPAAKILSDNIKQSLPENQHKPAEQQTAAIVKQHARPKPRKPRVVRKRQSSPSIQPATTQAPKATPFSDL